MDFLLRRCGRSSLSESPLAPGSVVTLSHCPCSRPPTTRNMPLSPSTKKSPFDIPEPQKSSELLTRDLELHLESCQSRLEARKRLLSDSIKALARLEADRSDRQKTDEERLATLVNKQDCADWIIKHRNAIETLQRHILHLEKKIKSLKPHPKRKKRGIRTRLFGKLSSAGWLR